MIPLSECPGFTLERLARDFIYDKNGSPLPFRTVRERLQEFEACQLFDSSDWDGYVQRMAEAGISPILWRELAKMNAGEEAAESYFRTRDAFRNIVGLIQEAQQPVSGERAKPLGEVAANVARQVSTQEQDRRTRVASEEASARVDGLANQVRTYADAREDVQQIADEAVAASACLKVASEGLRDELDAIEERADTFRERRLQNEMLHASEKMHGLTRSLADKEADALACREIFNQNQSLAQLAEKEVLLDDTAASRREYRSIEAAIRSKRERILVRTGELEADEGLVRARERALRKLAQAEHTSSSSLEAAQTGRMAADDAFAKAKGDYAQADAAVQDLGLELGRAQSNFEAAQKRVSEVAESVPGFDGMQKTLEGFYVSEVLALAAKNARAEEGKAHDALAHAQQNVRDADDAVGAARVALVSAEAQLSAKSAEHAMWQANLATAQDYDRQLRESSALWPDAIAAVEEGRYGDASDYLAALLEAARTEVHAQEDIKRSAEARLAALDSGSLDMSERLRAWLDAHELSPCTLAGHKGIPSDERDRLFEKYPWLAHALVVSDAESKRLLAASQSDEVTELGHAVFYIRQSDVQRLLETVSLGGSLFATGDAEQLVGALHTVEQAFLEDPEGYEAKLSARVEMAQKRLEKALWQTEMLSRAEDGVKACRVHLASIGMEDKTLADVVAYVLRTEEALHAASELREHREDELRAAVVAKEDAERALEVAAEREKEAVRFSESLASLCVLNDACIEAKRGCDEATYAHSSALRAKEVAREAQESARARLYSAQTNEEEAQRETNAVHALREQLEALSEIPEETVQPEGVCTSDELRATVLALKEIVEKNDRDLQALETELASLQDRLERETAWQDVLREHADDPLSITLEEIDAWQPRDAVGRVALKKRKRQSSDEAERARRESQKADNEVVLAHDRIEECQKTLSGLGLDEPLDVPVDYDYEETKARIDKDWQGDQDAYRQLNREKNRLDVYVGKLSNIADRLSKGDSFRASVTAHVPDGLALMSGLEAYASELEKRAKAGETALVAAQNGLEMASRSAGAAVAEMGERAAGRNIEDSVQTVRGVCTSREAIRAVASRLDDHGRQLKTIAETLKNKLRATDEAIEDLVGRAVEEAYMLTSELHRLVMVSSARIQGTKKQPTIRFRSRGHIVFQNEFKRDELSTSRLTHYVRSFVTEKLPGIEETKRPEEAAKELAPHELVYQLLDDRSVDVQYPVLRGGRGLSYEGARDTSGSGSTGQKSAGYVLSFLALLRYLGNSGALSAEGSLFVALENQFGKISSSKIIRDIKAVSDQTHMQLITVAGRELASAYEMGDVVYSLYRTKGTGLGAQGSASVMLAHTDSEDGRISDAIIDSYRATRRFENLTLDI